MTIAKTYIEFITEEHEDRYYQLLDLTNRQDIERQSLFYIIAGNDELFQYVNAIYDFDQEQLKITTRLGKLNALCVSTVALLKLGLHLYNNTNKSLSIYDTFAYLDRQNLFIALEAIKIRFGS